MDIEFNTSSLMLVFFTLSFIVSIWKIYPFLQTRVLEDDDTTEASQEELLKIILKYYDKDEVNPDTKKLLEKIKADADFDTNHFWRFNQNKLNQILNRLN